MIARSPSTKRLLLALLVSASSFALIASPALAATLSVRVTPTTIHLHSAYQIQISGTFKRGRVYLVAFIQYSSKACKPGPSQELARTHDTGGAFDAATIRRNPFVRVRSFRARSRSTRRVCAYLFERPVKPGTRTRPLARASAVYAVVS